MSIYHKVKDAINISVTALTFWGFSCPFCYAQSGIGDVRLEKTKMIEFGSYVRTADVCVVDLKLDSTSQIGGLRTAGGGSVSQAGRIDVYNCWGTYTQTYSSVSVSDPCAVVTPTVYSGNASGIWTYRNIGAHIKITNKQCKKNESGTRIIDGTFNIDVTCKSRISGNLSTASIPMNFVINIQEPPVVITETQALNFGGMISTPTAYSVKIEPNGNITGNTGMLVNIQGKRAHAGHFTIKGNPGTHVRIDLPQSAKLASSGGSEMTVSKITGVLNSGSLEETMSTGSTDLRIGGTLNVGASQPSGEYTGQYTVTIHY